MAHISETENKEKSGQSQVLTWQFTTDPLKKTK